MIGRCAALLLAIWAMVSPARAAPSCAVPADLAVPHVEAANDREPRRLLPIGGYTLAMIWMPESCRAGRGSMVCAGGQARGLALHGLWPDGEGKDWPQWCGPAPILPRSLIAAHYCATPSAQLIQHEWAKHGTCMAGYTPDRYFDLSNRLFAGIRAPDLRALSYRRPTVAGVREAFAAANPGIAPGMVRLNLDKRGWLEEIWLCLDTGFHPQRCPAAQVDQPAGDPVLIWRGGRGGAGARAAYRAADQGDGFQRPRKPRRPLGL